MRRQFTDRRRLAMQMDARSLAFALSPGDRLSAWQWEQMKRTGDAPPDPLFGNWFFSPIVEYAIRQIEKAHAAEGWPREALAWSAWTDRQTVTIEGERIQ
jgi:hypothetical protein